MMGKEPQSFRRQLKIVKIKKAPIKFQNSKNPTDPKNPGSDNIVQTYS